MHSDLERCGGTPLEERHVPITAGEFAAAVRAHYQQSTAEQSEYFLALAHHYARSGNESLFFMSICQYSFLAARLARGNNRQVRHYSQVVVWGFSRLPADGQRDLTNVFYLSLNTYFLTYNFHINSKEIIIDMADRFYAGLRGFLLARGRANSTSLGQCLSSVAFSNPSFILDLLNRIKTRADDIALFPIISTALCDQAVFKASPYVCIQLLSRLDIGRVSDALCRQLNSTAETRRTIASAVLDFSYDSQESISNTLLKPFASRASNELKRLLAFSLLLEPLREERQKLGSERKAVLIADALGIVSDPEVVEYFRARMAEIGDLFTRQSNTTDPNVRGSYGFNILENIRLSRKWLMARIRGDLKEEVVQFLRSVEGYVTTEQAKLIRDTELELSLASSRTVYDSTGTRITLEIRNVGHGSADGLELELIPVAGQYDVDERNRLIRIESLPDRIPIQRDIWIRPLVATNSSIELSTCLHYNTLKERAKSATLSDTKRTVSLYPETQFIRVAQPYSIGGPATTWFYGREGLLNNMTASLHYPENNDQSMIVYGLKRAGKTSVLKRFIDHTLRNQNESAQ